MAPATFTVSIDDETLAAFEDLATARGQDGARMIEQLIHEFVQRESEPEGYDAWFREQVEKALRESFKSDAVLIPHEEVMKDWRRQRGLLLARAADKAG